MQGLEFVSDHLELVMYLDPSPERLKFPQVCDDFTVVPSRQRGVLDRTSKGTSEAIPAVAASDISRRIFGGCVC